MTWNTLKSIEELNDFLNDTESRILALFKHSFSCGISGMARSRFEKSWNSLSENYPIRLVDVVKHREVSKKIESIFNVKHESPQFLLIKDGQCIYNASHFEIDVKIAIGTLLE